MIAVMFFIREALDRMSGMGSLGLGRMGFKSGVLITLQSNIPNIIPRPSVFAPSRAFVKRNCRDYRQFVE